MFFLDTDEKNEAVNYVTLMNILKMTEKRFDPMFSEFEKKEDISVPMTDKLVSYEHYFNVPKENLFNEYKKTLNAFLCLNGSDEIIKRGSLDYPILLDETEQAPRFLYLRGNKSLLYEKRTVSLVGSRQASEKACIETRILAECLGENGIIVISGLAKGIDASAHRAALDSGYNTISVIGTSLNQYYPPENKSIQLEIERKGLIVSQFSPASRTQKWFFPLRNGVMSGLSLATVIMEAGETSGALIQADYAIKQRRKVLIPTSAVKNDKISWPKKYVDRGAEVFANSQEALKLLSESDIFNPNKGGSQQTIDELLRNANQISDSNGTRMLNRITMQGN